VQAGRPASRDHGARPHATRRDGVQAVGVDELPAAVTTPHGGHSKCVQPGRGPGARGTSAPVGAEALTRPRARSAGSPRAPGPRARQAGGPERPAHRDVEVASVNVPRQVCCCRSCCAGSAPAWTWPAGSTRAPGPWARPAGSTRASGPRTRRGRDQQESQERQASMGRGRGLGSCASAVLSPPPVLCMIGSCADVTGRKRTSTRTAGATSRKPASTRTAAATSRGHASDGPTGLWTLLRSRSLGRSAAAVRAVQDRLLRGGDQQEAHEHQDRGRDPQEAHEHQDRGRGQQEAQERRAHCAEDAASVPVPRPVCRRRACCAGSAPART